MKSCYVIKHWHTVNQVDAFSIDSIFINKSNAEKKLHEIYDEIWEEYKNKPNIIFLSTVKNYKSIYVSYFGHKSKYNVFEYEIEEIDIEDGE